MYFSTDHPQFATLLESNHQQAHRRPGQQRAGSGPRQGSGRRPQNDNLAEARLNSRAVDTPRDLSMTASGSAAPPRMTPQQQLQQQQIQQMQQQQLAFQQHLQQQHGQAQAQAQAQRQVQVQPPFRSGQLHRPRDQQASPPVINDSMTRLVELDMFTPILLRMPPSELEKLLADAGVLEKDSLDSLSFDERVRVNQFLRRNNGLRLFANHTPNSVESSVDFNASSSDSDASPSASPRDGDAAYTHISAPVSVTERTSTSTEPPNLFDSLNLNSLIPAGANDFSDFEQEFGRDFGQWFETN